MLVSGTLSLAAKGRHGRATEKARQRYSSRVVHFFEKLSGSVERGGKNVHNVVAFLVYFR